MTDEKGDMSQSRSTPPPAYDGHSQPVAYQPQQNVAYHPQQNVAYQPQQPQVVYIQTQAGDGRDYSAYNGRLSVAFGVCLILLQTISLVVNGVSSSIQFDRDYDWVGNIWIVMWPPAWCGIFVYLAAGFMIGAGKSKSRCLIITNLVMTVIATFCICVSLIGIIGGTVYDADELTYSNVDYRDRVSMALTAILLILFIPMLVMAIWASTLSCRMCCCYKPRIAACENVQVVQTTSGGGATSAMAHAIPVKG